MERYRSRPRTDSSRPSARRRSLATLGLGALLLLQVVAVREALATPPPPTVWKQDGFSGSHQSYNSHETTITAANVATLIERWRTPDVGAINAPQVANGRLFVTTGPDAVALATDDGHELWRTTNDDPDNCGLYDHVLTPDGKLTVALGCIFGASTLAFDVATGASSAPALTCVPYRDPELRRTRRGRVLAQLRVRLGRSARGAARRVPGTGVFGNLATLYLSGPTVLRDQVFVGINAALQAFDLNSCPNPIPALERMRHPVGEDAARARDDAGRLPR